MNFKKIMKRFSRRNIVILSLIVVIFVMSLGYAALSQYTEIEGLAIIDRSWIIKVKEVTNSVTNNGVSISSPYVGTTVTMTANLPSTNSTVTYTIKLENQGNLKAKLHSIEKIEDDNTSITYTLSGVEEGVTTLNPGEENTVTVTIKAKDGVTSLSDTEKSVMLSFNYVENSVDSSGIPTNPTIYDEYSIGDKVKLSDDSIWYVVKDSNSTEEYVTIVSEDNYGTYAFDTSGSTMYDPTKDTNIGYTINNTIIPNIKTIIDNSDGISVGTIGRLLTLVEYNTFINLEKSFGNTPTWLMTEKSDTLVNYYNNELTTKLATEEGNLRLVIITLKENVSLYSQKLLVEQIKLDNIDLTNNQIPSDGINSTFVNNETPGINFTAPSSETNGKGLYVTSDLTNTEDIDDDGVGEPVYYFRGAVENNYVRLGSYQAGTTIFAGTDDEKTYGEDAPIYWRIVRINEDGSIRLVYHGTSANKASAFVTAYNESGNSIVYNGSNVKQKVETWYVETGLADSINNYLSDTTNFCNDYSGDFGKNVTGRMILGTPTFKCNSNHIVSPSQITIGDDMITASIGLLSGDEMLYAGAFYNSAYTSSDVYFKPSGIVMTSTRATNYVVYINDVGKIGNRTVPTRTVVFPVINLKSTVNYVGGNGEFDTPYILE